MKEAVLMQGNQAVAEGALAAGVKFCAGYPITPSTEVIEILSEKLPSHGGRFIQMEDELGSIGAVIGASAAGKKSMTATSGPGFSLMQENLGYAAMVELPIVIYNAQRVGPSTGGATKPHQADIMQAKWGSHGDSPRIAVMPGSVKEAYEITVKAFNLSEKYMVPVVILMDELLAHMRESIVIPDKEELEIVDRRRDALPEDKYLPYKIDETGLPVLPPLGGGCRYNISGMIHGEDGIPDLTPSTIDANVRRINSKLDKYYDDIVMLENEKNEKAKTALFVFGSTTRPAKGAVKKAKEAGVEVELIRPITIWPFPEKELKEIAERVDKIIVAEMNLGQTAGLVKQAVEGKAEVIQHNRVDSGHISVEELYEKIMEVSS
ncbi:2-oxoglutarate ferredoxin oxidoreductase subunit alpha [Halanaerobium sp. DL-01]|jgi:2-oxoglutarate ferredoxin oxidoreductase subunit alpha|uniref:2-oxoacid:acceptor oxidoreductase subunit alpha n=3 Tax=unclassified Halanaerobium TaxID=2641197 RepID=UPI000DF322AB|nr:2-oxoacid:acceptor oxidoreductase subunit alpha [Halanaerobium sp. DL-01]RCW77841.1 2-oxoglutarate ferredoxin oxidoreductase subunit alpha [Halanaerobium sp. DL-01]